MNLWRAIVCLFVKLLKKYSEYSVINFNNSIMNC